MDKDLHRTSRLHRVGDRRHYWQAPNGTEVELPAMLDLIWREHDNGPELFRVEAVVSLVFNAPHVTSVSFVAREGLDLSALQHSFNWQTPLDIVCQLIPKLIKAGIDPFEYSYPVDGYAEDKPLETKQKQKLTDAFLETIAEEYLRYGRGYPEKMSQVRGVPKRTIISWVEKARQRGILTYVSRGQVGGRIVPRDRRLSQSNDLI